MPRSTRRLDCCPSAMEQRQVAEAPAPCLMHCAYQSCSFVPNIVTNGDRRMAGAGSESPIRQQTEDHSRANTHRPGITHVAALTDTRARLERNGALYYQITR